MAQQEFSTLVIQDLFKILTNYKAIRLRILSAARFQIFKKKNKEKKKISTTKIQNHKMPHFDKTFIISRSYIKYCRLYETIDPLHK